MQGAAGNRIEHSRIGDYKAPINNSYIVISIELKGKGVASSDHDLIF